MSSSQAEFAILDVESTLSPQECLPMLALEAGGGELEAHVHGLTEQAMNNGWDFRTSLERRVGALVEAGLDVEHITTVARRFQATPSVYENRAWFAANPDKFMAVSGGFRPVIGPMLSVDLGIPPENLRANDFTYGPTGNVTGFNRDNPLSQAGGKALVVQKEGLDPNNLIAIGDGMNDLDTRLRGYARVFGLYTEVVRRGSIADRPEVDVEFRTFDEVVNYLGAATLHAA